LILERKQKTVETAETGERVFSLIL